jgi:hypothetical protein
VGVTRPRRIEVHIDELILRGVDRSHAQRIAEAVQSELAALLAANGLPPAFDSSVTVERMEGDSTRGGPDAEGIGDGIGRSVFGGLHRWIS